jgi:hypothetical protein
MNARLDDINKQLSEITGEVRSTFGNLTNEQLNWKTSPDSWSIAQCLDHLILTGRAFKTEFERLASGTRKNTFWQQYSPFSSLAGKLLIKAIKSDAKKVKAPTPVIVPPSEIPDGIIDRFAEANHELARRIASTVAADWRKQVVTSPFAAAVTYTVDDAYTVLIEHERRHLRQARRVIETEGFPSS